MLVFSGFLSSSPVTGQDMVQPASSAATLKDFFHQALKNSERIAISEAAVRQAEAFYRQTLGGALPEFLYRRQTLWDDSSDSSRDGMFRITKTDLTGYRELAALSSGRSTVEQRKYERQRAEQLLLQDVASAFYSLLLAEENVSATKTLIELARERLAELEERVRVGRTREADTIGQEVLMASLESQLEESQRQVDARRDLLAFLAGVRDLEQPVAEGAVDMESLSLENYLARAGTRPDIQAARENVNSLKALRKVADADFFPSLNLSANSYTDRSQSHDADWDVSLSVDVPLWDWGARKGTVKAATAVLDQAEKNLQLNLRQADLDIRNAYRDYQSTQKQLAIRAKSVELARRDYQMQVRDDRQGLVTSLEVFESLDRLNTAELAFNNARLQERLAAVNLKIAAGAKPDEILK